MDRRSFLRWLGLVPAVPLAATAAHLHTGGIAAGEVPAILNIGESVLPIVRRNRNLPMVFVRVTHPDWIQLPPIQQIAR